MVEILENLKPLRRHNASIIFGAFFSVAALVLLTVIALLVLQDSKIFAYCAGAVVALGGTVAASIVLSHSTLKSSEFLSMVPSCTLLATIRLSAPQMLLPSQPPKTL